MAKRTEGQWEKAYKELKFYIKATNLCTECKTKVLHEIGIIERDIKSDEKKDRVYYPR